MNFDSIESDTITVQDGEMDELVGLVNGGEISCRYLRIVTDVGTVTVDAAAMSLTISTDGDATTDRTGGDA